jgi:hypothetical protein
LKSGSQILASSAPKPEATASPTTRCPRVLAAAISATAPPLITCTMYTGTLTYCARRSARAVPSSCSRQEAASGFWSRHQGLWWCYIFVMRRRGSAVSQYTAGNGPEAALCSWSRHTCHAPCLSRADGIVSSHNLDAGSHFWMDSCRPRKRLASRCSGPRGR